MINSVIAGLFLLHLELSYLLLMRQPLLSCARHGTSLAGESPVTGIYRQV